MDLGPSTGTQPLRPSTGMINKKEVLPNASMAMGQYFVTSTDSGTEQHADLKPFWEDRRQHWDYILDIT